MGCQKCNIKVSQLALHSFSCAKNAPPAARAIAVHWLLRVVVPACWEGARGSLATPPEWGILVDGSSYVDRYVEAVIEAEGRQPSFAVFASDAEWTPAALAIIWNVQSDWQR